jgi:hypothetical protein
MRRSGGVGGRDDDDDDDDDDSDSNTPIAAHEQQARPPTLPAPGPTLPCPTTVEGEEFFNIKILTQHWAENEE